MWLASSCFIIMVLENGCTANGFVQSRQSSSGHFLCFVFGIVSIYSWHCLHNMAKQLAHSCRSNGRRPQPEHLRQHNMTYKAWSIPWWAYTSKYTCLHYSNSLKTYWSDTSNLILASTVISLWRSLFIFEYGFLYLLNYTIKITDSY